METTLTFDKSKGLQVHLGARLAGISPTLFNHFIFFFRRVQSTARPEKENQANEIRKRANIVPKTKEKRKAREIFRLAVSYPGSREFENCFVVTSYLPSSIVRYLLYLRYFAWRIKQTFEFSGPYSRVRPAN